MFSLIQTNSDRELSPRAQRDQPSNMAGLLREIDALHSAPVINLASAIYALGLMDLRALVALWREDPDLLRSKSSTLVRRFLLKPEQLQHALARSAGVAEVDIAHFDIEEGVHGKISKRVMSAQDVIALGQADGILYAASWCPTNEDLHGMLCASTGQSVILVWAERAAIAARVAQLAKPNALVATQSAGIVDEASTERSNDLPNEPQIHELIQLALNEITIGQEPDESSLANEASSMVRMFKRLIQDAQDRKATDIHIETYAGEEFTRIRLRRDGDLELYEKLPPELRAPLVARIKIMARLDVAERRRPQDGKINFADLGGNSLEMHVAVMPTHDGLEDVVLRLLAACKPVALSQLDLQERDAQALARMLTRTFGLILAAGPFGSGKTTALHSLLAEINSEERKIWTVEDPIEITHAGLRQVEVNPKIGLSFASAVRGFLRADPDIIAVGEIRDEETAKIALEASLTGHLVFSTLNANSASESVVRLLELGMDRVNFSDSLVGIVAQRLVRSLCPKCAQERAITPEEWAELVAEYIHTSPLDAETGAARLLAAAGVSSPAQVRVKKAKGCPHCGGTGYKGRIGIYEILENSPTIRNLIEHNARPADIFDEAVRTGMRSLRHDALEKYVQGRIDIRPARIAYV
jgi:type II secretory ATPase GspE/PulE/Tfp pilus assembly ATPase PilB-like protein